MTVSLIHPLFAKLQAGLSALIKTIGSCPQPKTDFLHTLCSPEKQVEFGHLLLKAMGFKKESSRLDLSTHPFCSGMNLKDTRMTTRIHPEALLSWDSP